MGNGLVYYIYALLDISYCASDSRGDAVRTTAKEILIKGLQAMDADGLYSLTGCDESCGCGIDDLMPCGCGLDDIDGVCFPAKKRGKSFYPMEEQ